MNFAHVDAGIIDKLWNGRLHRSRGSEMFASQNPARYLPTEEWRNNFAARTWEIRFQPH